MIVHTRGRQRFIIPYSGGLSYALGEVGPRWQRVEQVLALVLLTDEADTAIPRGPRTEPAGHADAVSSLTGLPQLADLPIAI